MRRITAYHQTASDSRQDVLFVIGYDSTLNPLAIDTAAASCLNGDGHFSSQGQNYPCFLGCISLNTPRFCRVINLITRPRIRLTTGGVKNIAKIRQYAPALPTSWTRKKISQ